MAHKVMITAAAGGMGRVVAKAFHDQGAAVHICDIDEAALDAFRAEHPHIPASLVDVRSEAQIDGWFDLALADMGGLDVMINNAGSKGPTAPVEEIDPADWRECLEIGLDSFYLCARRAAPILKRQRHGTIINVSSTAGLVGFGNRTPYTAAKWATIGLTKSLAIELGPHNVTCNAICPGSVMGERIQQVIDHEADVRGVDPQIVADQLVFGQSIARLVDPQEIADLCLFLASPAARMISGQAIAVDGHTETFHIR